MNDELQFANIKLDEQTMTKTIASLVIQVSNLQKENADNINRMHELEEEFDKENIEKIYYKALRDKAIKYIKRYEQINGYYDSCYDGEYDTYSHDNVKEELLDILKGSDTNVKNQR